MKLVFGVLIAAASALGYIIWGGLKDYRFVDMKSYYRSREDD
jgi:hypothetical protein